MAAYAESIDANHREKLVEALSGMDEPPVTEFMRSITRQSSEREAFLANLYLARQGDQKALENLNRAGGNVASYEWAAALSLFGKYRYRPAVDTLIEALGGRLRKRHTSSRGKSTDTVPRGAGRVPID